MSRTDLTFASTLSALITMTASLAGAHPVVAVILGAVITILYGRLIGVGTEIGTRR